MTQEKCPKCGGKEIVEGTYNKHCMNSKCDYIVMLKPKVYDKITRHAKCTKYFDIKGHTNHL